MISELLRKCKFIDNHKQENYLCFKNPTTKEQFKYLMSLSAPYFYSQLTKQTKKIKTREVYHQHLMRRNLVGCICFDLKADKWKNFPS